MQTNTPINLIVVTSNVSLAGNPYVLVGCKQTQPDDPSLIEDFATFEEAVTAYLDCTYPIKTIEFWQFQ